jgi:hypothetical protein
MRIMKKIMNCCFLFIGILSVAGCSKSFEDHPLNFVSEDYIWDKTDVTGTYAKAFVARIYSQIPTGYTRLNGVPLDCVSDDAVPSNGTNASWNVINGGYNPLITFDDNWSNSYGAIRNVNIFLANYKRVPWADTLNPQWLSAEVRVLRAYFYYEMMKRYGGVPLIGDKVFDYNDPALIQLKRSSFSDCVNYVVSELDAVKENLRPDATLASKGSGNGTTDGTDADAGRMRKSIAMAIKAKVLLLAASPLFNPSATPDKDFTGYPAASPERWKAAADAAKAVMNLNLFALESSRYIFNTTRVNKEFVFMRYGVNNTNSYGYMMSPVGYNPGMTASQGLVSPTQELVDAFPMKNGKAITEGTSGYDPANPYSNRDPRLDQTIFYNGATWLKRPVETFEGGLDKPNSIAVANGVQTQTGYYAKKFLANDANNTAFTNTLYHPSVTSTWCIIRYADILLMYAEAQNEYSGPDASIYSAVEAVRQRAGLIPYTLPAGLNQLDMQKIIRNERRLELAFEEQRFYDIRRWKIASTVYGGATLHGVKIIKTAPNTYTYTPVNVATPYFTAANMYLLPVASKEVLTNRNLQQNPNY